MLAAPSVSWLFTLILHARAFQPDTLPPHPYDEAVDNGTFGYYPTWNYATEPDIIAPKTNWLQWSPECNDGLFYFITPRGWGIERPGPMILDWKGDLVWSKHFANEWGGQAYDFMVQSYQGQEYLTFWTGDDRVRGHGSGSYMMLDSSYELIHSVDAGHNLTADLHEFLLTRDGTALITVYQKYQHDLSTWRTFNATADPNDAEPNWIWDCVLQEVAVSTGDVFFEWRASEHIDINDTYHAFRQAGNHEDPFDWFHMNSIQKDELGNYLVSARYTHSITYIDGRSGKVIWTLGGKQNMFMDLSDGHAINFAWQHDAQFVSPDMFPVTYKPPPEQSGYTTRLISLFDNAAEDQNYVYGMNMSRGLLLELTFPTPGVKATGKKGRPRDISHLRKLAAESNQHISKIASQTRPNLPYPNYGKDKPESTEDVEAIKFNQTNGSNPSYTVRLIQAYYNPAHVRSSSQGSMQLLPPTSNDTDAKVLLGYGLNAVFTEFDANGSALCDAHYGAVTSWERGDIQSYRAYKLPWVGRPKYPPRLVMVEDDEHTAHVSWNGATEVAAWVLQTSDRNDTGWRELQSKPRLGFETSFDLSSSRSPQNTAPERFLRARALDKHGKALEHGFSEPLDRVAVARQFAEAKEALAAAEEEEAEQRKKSDSNKNPSPSRASVLTGAVLVLVAAFSLYEAYRRYLCWKVGRPAVGAVRWRKGGGGSAGYRLLGDV